MIELKFDPEYTDDEQKVTFEGDIWIAGPQREQFEKELDDLLAKFTI